jgi:hypothetical protein
MGMIYFARRDYNRALEFFIKSYRIFNALGEKSVVAEVNKKNVESIMGKGNFPITREEFYNLDQAGNKERTDPLDIFKNQEPP